MRTLRIASQTLFFLLFSLSFFFLARLSHGYQWDAEWFLRLNPLTALSVSIASRSFFLPLVISGLVMALATLVLGRFFCGFMCPLGSSIDLVDRFVFRGTRHSQRRPPVSLQRVKYVLLVLCLVPVLLGSLFPLFFDPISIVTRFFTFLIHPFSQIIGKDLLSLAARPLGLVGLDGPGLIAIKVPLYFGATISLALALLVFGGGYWDRRFWCQYLCPTGAFLGS